ncbi:MAG: hypothetical protein HY589_05000, partial [Candidatus Omnitrophica bacterium]|nr:hypothetical protein [Candidatus Omnitrophota bacterium]
TTEGIDNQNFEQLKTLIYLSGLLPEDTRNADGELVSEVRMRLTKDLIRLPLLKKQLIDDPRMSTEDDNSELRQWMFARRDANKVAIYGSLNNCRYLKEIELKFKEEGWVGTTCYDLADPSGLDVIESEVDPDSEALIIVDAMDTTRFDETLKILKQCKRSGKPMLVLTSSDHKNIYGELSGLADEAEGRIKLVDIPTGRREVVTVTGQTILLEESVDRDLQGHITYIYGFKGAVAFARAKGQTDEQVDNPRSLAKSVTVHSKPAHGRQYTTNDHQEAFKDVDVAAEMARYAETMQARWSDVAEGREQAIWRLPLETHRFLRSMSDPESGAYLIPAEKLTAQFGNKLNDLKKIVVICDDPDMMRAAETVEVPFRYREAIDTKTINDSKSIWCKEGMSVIQHVPLNGKLFSVAFNRERRTITFIPEKETSEEAAGEIAPVTVIGDETGIEVPEVTINGRAYQIRSTKKRGVILVAKEPDLLGRQVVYHRSTDRDLIYDTADKGSLIVVLSRSNNRGREEKEFLSIDDPVKGPDAARLRQVSGQYLPETGIDKALRGLPQERVIVMADQNSSLARRDGENWIGTLTLPDNMDAVSAPGLAECALMHLGGQLGRISGIQEADIAAHARVLETVPLVEARMLADKFNLVEGGESTIFDYALRKLIELRWNILDRQYTTMMAIGGVQDRYNTVFYAGACGPVGLLVDGEPADHAPHGPIAITDVDIQKFYDLLKRIGVNVNYDSNNSDDLRRKDSLILVLLTDPRGFAAALLDYYRFRTRNAREMLISPVREMGRAEVSKSGAHAIV